MGSSSGKCRRFKATWKAEKSPGICIERLCAAFRQHLDSPPSARTSRAVDLGPRRAGKRRKLAAGRNADRCLSTDHRAIASPSTPSRYRSRTSDHRAGRPDQRGRPFNPYPLDIETRPSDNKTAGCRLESVPQNPLAIDRSDIARITLFLPLSIHLIDTPYQCLAHRNTLAIDRLAIDAKCHAHPDARPSISTRRAFVFEGICPALRHRFGGYRIVLSGGDMESRWNRQRCRGRRRRFDYP